MPTLLSPHANVAMRLIVNGLLEQQRSKLVITAVNHVDAANQSSRLTFYIRDQAEKSTALSNFSCDSFAHFMWLLLSNSTAIYSKSLNAYFGQILTTLEVPITDTHQPLFAKLQTLLPLVNFKLAMHVALDTYKTQYLPLNSASQPLEMAIEQSPSLETLKTVLTTAFKTPPLVKKTHLCCFHWSKPETIALALSLNSSTQRALIGYLMNTFKDYDTETFGLPLEIDAETDYQKADAQTLINALNQALRVNAAIVTDTQPPGPHVDKGTSTLTAPLLGGNENTDAIPGPYTNTLASLFPKDDSNSKG